MRYAHLALLPIALCLACESTSNAPGTWTGTVRDSSGITIVEHSGIPEDLPVWAIGPVPALSIGTIDGTGADLFGRISAVVERSDGVVVVAESQALEVRAFDPSGAHLWTFGGPGGGPREFSGLGDMFLMSGDSVLAWNRSARRMTVVDPNGSYVRSFPTPPPPEEWGGYGAQGALGDGTLVFQTSEQSSSEDGVHHQSRLFTLHDQDGTLLASVGPYPGPTNVTETGEFEVDGRTLTGFTIRGLQFSRSTEIAITARSLVVALPDAFRILRLDATGEATMELRVAVAPVPPDIEGYARYWAAERGEPDDWRDLARSTEERGVAEALPPYRQVMVDASGRLWIQEYVPYGDQPPTWWIVDSDGAFVGQVTLPESFTLQQILEDHVIGIWEDEFDVPYVRSYAVARPG